MSSWESADQVALSGPALTHKPQFITLKSNWAMQGPCPRWRLVGTWWGPVSVPHFQCQGRLESSWGLVSLDVGQHPSAGVGEYVDISLMCYKCSSLWVRHVSPVLNLLQNITEVGRFVTQVYKSMRCLCKEISLERGRRGLRLQQGPFLVCVCPPCINRSLYWATIAPSGCVFLRAGSAGQLFLCFQTFQEM